MKHTLPPDSVKLALYKIMVITFIFLWGNITQAQWVASYDGFVAVEALAINGNNIVAATHNNGMYFSPDSGATWAASTGLPVASITYSLTYNGNDVFAGTDGNHGMYHSSDNGANWALSTFSNPWFLSLFVDGSNMFAGTNGNGIYLSTDNGANWATANAGLGTNPWAFAFAKMGTNLFIAGGSGSGDGVFMSTDNGVNWTHPTNAGWTGPNVRTLAVIGTNLFAGTFHDGMYLSTNNGENWTAINTGMTNLNVRSVISVENNLFAGTYGGGVFLSTDNGANWNAVNTGLTYLYVSSLTICDGYLFAGGIGVWKRHLSDMLPSSVTEIKGAHLPEHFVLHQNYPNPFNPSTQIIFDVAHAGNVTLNVSNLLGEDIITLANGYMDAGTYQTTFNAHSLPSGMYYYTLRSGGTVQTKKMLLAK